MFLGITETGIRIIIVVCIVLLILYILLVIFSLLSLYNFRCKLKNAYKSFLVLLFEKEKIIKICVDILTQKNISAPKYEFDIIKNLDKIAYQECFNILNEIYFSYFKIINENEDSLTTFNINKIKLFNKENEIQYFRLLESFNNNIIKSLNKLIQSYRYNLDFLSCIHNFVVNYCKLVLFVRFLSSPR